LVIDDEMLVRATIEAILRGRGHSVAVANNGREGLKRLQESSFDLIITDLIMPDTEGIETIQAIRKEPKPPRILAISGGGRGQVGDFLDIAVQLGADYSLRKPFSPDELMDAVDRAMAAPLQMPSTRL
jgi:CheY-like chemotaxis protein